MRKLSYKKLFAIAALVALVLVLLPIAGPAPSSHAPLSISSFSPNIAFAQDKPTDNVLSCITSPFTCAVVGISWLINKILSWVIMLGGFLATAIFKLNGTLFDSPVVQVGFSITLAFANLGFVLAIIVIAIATILRNQTYGVKQLLWKLVLMAILVNFGLVITRPVVALSDSMSNYFIQQMSGNTGDWVGNLTAAFGPQVLPGVAGAVPPGNGSASNSFTPSACQGIQSTVGKYACTIGLLAGGPGITFLANAVTSNPDLFMQTVLSLVFSATFLAIVAFSLIALAILLLIRYLYITFLLILLPLAWLAWVFPGMKSHFDKWCHLFLRWTFFPAISLFFIYLAVLIAPLAQVNGSANQNANYISNGLGTGVSGSPTTLTSGGTSQSIALAQQSLADLVLCGLVLGGLYAANALGIAGAGVAMGYGKAAAGWVGKKAGGAAARQGKKAASAAVQENVKQKLQSGNLKGIGRFIPKRLQVAAGIGLGNVQKAGGSKLVDQESAWAKEQGKDVGAASRMLGSGGLSEAKRFALLKELNNNKKFDPTKTKTVDGQDINTFLQDKNRFDKYQQGNLRDDLNNSANGASSSTMAASAALAAGGGLESGATVKDEAGLLGEVGATVDALELLRKSIEKTARNMDKNDLRKQNLNYMYSNENINGAKNKSTKDLRIEQLRVLIKTKPQLIASHLPGMSSPQIDNFNDVFRIAIAAELDEAIKSNDDTRLGRLGEVEKSFNKAYSRIISGDWTSPDEVEERKPDEPKAPEGGGKKS